MHILCDFCVATTKLMRNRADTMDAFTEAISTIIRLSATKSDNKTSLLLTGGQGVRSWTRHTMKRSC